MPWDGSDGGVTDHELIERGRKAFADDAKAAKQKKEDDAKSLRVGDYVITEESEGKITTGSPRPFVYVPKGFDLNARGAIGQVLEALGVKEALDGQAAPSIVLRVSGAAGRPDHEKAAAALPAHETKAPLLVPVVIALSAAFSAYIAFELLTQRLNANNTAMGQLKNLEIWWRGLTSLQRQHPAAKEILVRRAEDALILEIASISQLALRLDDKRADGAYEDEDARGSRRSDAGKSSE